MNAVPTPDRDSRRQDFHDEWMRRLDHFLPVPCLVLGAVAVPGSAVPLITIAITVVYLMANLVVSQLAQRDSQVQYFGPARVLLTVVSLVLLCWTAGPESNAWSMALISIFAGVFALSGRAQVFYLTLFTLSTLLGTWLGGRGLIDTAVIGGILCSVAWLASALSFVLYETWIKSDDNATALAAHNEILEKALAARQDFLATMSHEVRTPLNGVLGMTELLRATPMSSEQVEMLETIQDSGEGLLLVLNDILDTAKLDAGKLELEDIPFDPTKLCLSVCSLMRAKTHNSPLSLRFDLPDGPLPPSVSGDPARLRQVLLNLVGNALKFTTEGEVVLGARWRDGALKLHVSDTGIGISEQAQAEIFEPFTQAETGTTRTYGGTGLGLAICHRLVSLMEGTLSLESTLGEGSCFMVQVSAPLAQGQAAPMQAASGYGLPRSVLLVEDNQVNLMVASRMLDALGCTYQTATNGEEALLAVEKQSFDAILMDCRMPVMNGYEATRRLRSQGYGRPILALTAGVTSEERAACAAAGMDAVLAKPMTKAKLSEALSALMSPERIPA